MTKWALRSWNQSGGKDEDCASYRPQKCRKIVRWNCNTKGPFVTLESENGKWIRESRMVIYIYTGTHKFSLSISHFSWAPQTLLSHHYLIYLYFPSLPSYTYFHFYHILSVQPNEPLRAYSLALNWEMEMDVGNENGDLHIFRDPQVFFLNLGHKL